MRFVVLCFLMFALCGCGSDNHWKGKDRKPQEPGVVDYMVWAEQIRQYKRTKVKLEGIGERVKKNYEEVVK